MGILIDRAEHEIDLAAYVLNDWPIVQALTRAALEQQRLSHAANASVGGPRPVLSRQIRGASKPYFGAAQTFLPQDSGRPAQP